MAYLEVGVGAAGKDAATLGKETSDPENGLHCPFFEELHAIFTERAKNMQRLLIDSEAGSTQAKKRVKKMSVERSFDELSEDVDEDEVGSWEEGLARSNSHKRKRERYQWRCLQE
ncbi:hypothetical protein GH714_041080 [Hevea brasiliensis]|uniref:Uncharacterized protein n=1 Tax=Hevea brasiliensis TaxID=3981 RepID=A0A6A6MU52_HEVBR|nr:hypothetical protein GH714_041080 [Hevea brasiliensis]